MVSLGIQRRWTEILPMVQLVPTPLVVSLVMEATGSCPLISRQVELEAIMVAPADRLVQRRHPLEIIIATCLKSNVSKASGLVDMIVGRGCPLEAASRRHQCHRTMEVLISRIDPEASAPCKVCPYRENTLFRTIL